MSCDAKRLNFLNLKQEIVKRAPSSNDRQYPYENWPISFLHISTQRKVWPTHNNIER